MGRSDDNSRGLLPLKSGGGVWRLALRRCNCPRGIAGFLVYS